jgi:hypothetical protein
MAQEKFFSANSLIFSAISAVKSFFENCLIGKVLGTHEGRLTGQSTRQTTQICLACITFLR